MTSPPVSCVVGVCSDGVESVNLATDDPNRHCGAGRPWDKPRAGVKSHACVCIMIGRGRPAGRADERRGRHDGQESGRRDQLRCQRSQLESLDAPSRSRDALWVYIASQPTGGGGGVKPLQTRRVRGGASGANARPSKASKMPREKRRASGGERCRRRPPTELEHHALSLSLNSPHARPQMPWRLETLENHVDRFDWNRRARDR